MNRISSLFMFLAVKWHELKNELDTYKEEQAENLPNQFFPKKSERTYNNYWTRGYFVYGANVHILIPDLFVGGTKVTDDWSSVKIFSKKSGNGGWKELRSGNTKFYVGGTTTTNPYLTGTQSIDPATYGFDYGDCALFSITGTIAVR